MSLFNPAAAQCPNCGTAQDVQLVGSINADRRPDLRQQILDRTFQAHECTSCGALFRFPPQFVYIDLGRQQWILAHARAELADWRELEAEAQEIFDGNFGAAAPASAREIGALFTPEIVFGWPALREKLIAHELGLDSVELELTKMAAIRAVPGAPLSDDTELRLERMDGDTLVLNWVEMPSEATLTTLRLPRTVYDAIAADHADWAALRAELAGHPYADLNRLLHAA